MLSDDAKKAVIYSVIASVIVIVFVQTLLGLIWHVLNWLSVNFYLGFVDGIYKRAAMGSRDYASFALLDIVTGLVTGFLMATTLIVWRRGRKVEPDLEDRGSGVVTIAVAGRKKGRRLVKELGGWRSPTAAT
jgi:cbb3-type cytochrome oxidase subunit 3